MKFDIIKSRRAKLKINLLNKFKNVLLDADIDSIILIFDTYEKDNIDTIEKLKRKKAIDTKKISGALKQTINAHGPITKILIGSATKRIYGSLLEPSGKQTLIEKIKKWITFKR